MKAPSKSLRAGKTELDDCVSGLSCRKNNTKYSQSEAWEIIFSFFQTSEVFAILHSFPNVYLYLLIMIGDLLHDVLITSLIEWAAFISSLLYVWLAACQNNWCWHFAAISSALYVYLCYVAQLYADTLLQVFYVFMAFVGWINWRKGVTNTRKVVRIHWKYNLFCVAISTVIGLLTGYGLFIYTGNPGAWADGLIFSFSLIATLLLSQKYLENWIYFIVIDLVAIPLFWSRSLKLTALLYLLYTIFAFIGYLNWLKDYKKQTS